MEAALGPSDFLRMSFFALMPPTLPYLDVFSLFGGGAAISVGNVLEGCSRESLENVSRDALAICFGANFEFDTF